MADENGPQLDAETWEEIGTRTFTVQKRYAQLLAPFAEDSPISTSWPGLGMGGIGANDGLPPAPKQPASLRKLLGKYAVELFDIELAFYPNNRDKLPIWRQSLASKIERAVISHATRIRPERPLMATLGSLGLTYHLSAEEMAEAVRTALKSRTEGAAISPPSHTIAKANPLPISASTVKQQRSPQQIVDTFCDKRGWSLDKLADEAGVDRRQVFRVRHGKRVRRFALAAIAEVLGVEPENLISAVVPRLH